MCKHCWDDNRAVHHKDYIRGYEELDGFDKEVNYYPKNKKSKAVNRYPGCDGNDKGPHVYVWTTERNGSSFFSEYFGFEKFEKKVCAGCGHADKRRTTAEYNARNDREKQKRVAAGQRVWKYFSFEDWDTKYREKRDDYVRRHGWSEFIYGGWLY